MICCRSIASSLLFVSVPLWSAPKTEKLKTGKPVKLHQIASSGCSKKPAIFFFFSSGRDSLSGTSVPLIHARFPLGVCRSCLFFSCIHRPAPDSALPLSAFFPFRHRSSN